VKAETEEAPGYSPSLGPFLVRGYDEVIRRLEEAGAGAPEGRSNHFALETNGEIQVFDVWESQQAFEAFGATLLPIMAELGADPASRWSPGSTT
jgi:hypothetical protein